MKQGDAYQDIVVGGGIAGLTAAAYLSRKGRRVLLIEKNSVCGGLVNSFIRNGFHFDAGVRALENAGIILPMIKDLGLSLEFVKSPVSLGVADDVLNIETIKDLHDYRALLIRLYPESQKEIDAVLQDLRRIMKHMDVLYGVENPFFKNPLKNPLFLITKILPWFPRFLLTIGKINSMNGPIEEYLETHVTNPSLRDILSQHFFRNTPAFFALSYFSLYLDYFYPKGGTGKLAEVLEKAIAGWNGEIRTNTTIVEHLAATRTLQDQHGNTYTYENLLWAADLKTFYRLTDIHGMKEKICRRFEWQKADFLQHRGGDSVFTLFLQVDEPLESFEAIAHGHFFYTASKRGLGDLHRKQQDTLLASWDNLQKDDVFEWLEKMLALHTYEISIPGLKDASLVPEGKTGLIISFLTEYHLFKKVYDAGWYNEFISTMESQIISVLSESVYPFLKTKVIDKFSFSPLDIEKRIGSSEGAITGWSFEDSVPVINQIQSTLRAVSTPLPKVYQAGQWTYSPAGVPMSMLTAKLAVNKLLWKDCLHRRRKKL